MVHWTSCAVATIALLGASSWTTVESTSSSSSIGRSSVWWTSSFDDLDRSSWQQHIVVRGGGAQAPLTLSHDDELGSVEITIPMSQSNEVMMAGNSPLFRDIQVVTDILLGIVQEEDPKIHDLYLEFWNLGKERYVCVCVVLVSCFVCGGLRFVGHILGADPTILF